MVVMGWGGGTIRVLRATRYDWRCMHDAMMLGGGQQCYLVHGVREMGSRRGKGC